MIGVLFIHTEAQLLKALEKADVECARSLIAELPEDAVAKILNIRSGEFHNSFLHRLVLWP